MTHIMPITIITITPIASTFTRHSYALKRGKKELFGECSGSGPEGAAAYALQKAIEFDDGGGYSIFAPKSVLAHIPEDLRSRRPGFEHEDLTPVAGGSFIKLPPDLLEIARKLGGGDARAGVIAALRIAQRESGK